MMKAGFLDSGGGAKKKKINDSDSGKRVNSATDMSIPTVMDLSKQAVKFPSLETLNGKPTDGLMLDSHKPGNNSPGVSNSYANVTSKPSRKSVNFRTLFTPGGNGVDVVVPVESIKLLANGFLIQHMVSSWENGWLTPLFSFQFSSMDGLNAMLENGLWFIRNNLLILKKWNPDVNLLKEDVRNVQVWVKLHGVPVTTFSEDGLSAIATKLDTPLMLDSYTSDMCLQS
ncbi:putative reverse transcriptase domain-containing protein [Tanacetum coccineum]